MKKFKFNQTHLFIGSMLLTILFLTACAESTSIEACRAGTPYGFLGGLWHGIIAPVGFVLSIFSDNIAMYAVNNNGGWYDFGFVLGAGILFGGSGRAGR